MVIHSRCLKPCKGLFTPSGARAYVFCRHVFLSSAEMNNAQSCFQHNSKCVMRYSGDLQWGGYFIHVMHKCSPHYLSQFVVLVVKEHLGFGRPPLAVKHLDFRQSWKTFGSIHFWNMFKAWLLFLHKLQCAVFDLASSRLLQNMFKELRSALSL